MPVARTPCDLCANKDRHPKTTDTLSTVDGYSRARRERKTPFYSPDHMTQAAPFRRRTPETDSNWTCRLYWLANGALMIYLNAKPASASIRHGRDLTVFRAQT